MRRPLTVGVLAAVLVGCGAPVAVDPAGAPDPHNETGQRSGSYTPGPAPTALLIPRIGVNTPLDPLGLDPDGTVEEPPVTQPDVTGWYSLGVRPGDQGPAVILGHVSGRPPGAPRAIPGVFARLSTLQVGDEVTVERAGAPAVRFTVYDRKTVLKDRFPTVAVYGNTAGPELRLITCGGRFRPEVSSYESNIIVWAKVV